MTKKAVPAGRQGFTLIELLVVVSLIGILATLVLANLTSGRSRGRDAQRKSDLRQISTALRLYYNDNGAYPAAASLPWGSEWASPQGSVYMSTLPIDPLSDQSYLYKLGSDSDPTDADTYRLTACLENLSDDKGMATSADGDSDTSTSWCPSDWMYQIKP